MTSKEVFFPDPRLIIPFVHARERHIHPSSSKSAVGADEAQFICPTQCLCLMRNYRPLESARKLPTVRPGRVAAGYQNILRYIHTHTALNNLRRPRRCSACLREDVSYVPWPVNNFQGGFRLALNPFTGRTTREN